MSSLIFSDLQDQLDNGFFNPFNLSNLPGGDWVAALPCKIVLQVIDQLHLVQDRNTIRSLALTCRKLNAYCVPIVFHAINIGSPDPKSGKVYPRQAVSALRRLAFLMKRRPYIAKFVQDINIKWLPYLQSDCPSGIQECREAEGLFSYVLARNFAALDCVSIDTGTIPFRKLSPTIQHSLLSLLESPKLFKLTVTMRSFPITILECAHTAFWMSLCGEIQDDPRRPYVPLTLDPSVSRPSALEMCRVPNECLELLVNKNTPRVDLRQLKLLRFGPSEVYTPQQDAMVRNAASTLMSVSLNVKDWMGSDVLFPFGKLGALKTLELNTAMAPGFEVMGLILPDGEEISGVLSWLAASVRAQPVNEALDMITITLSMEKDLKLSPVTILRFHRDVWSGIREFQFQRRWPELQTLPIFGGSVVTAGETVVISCLGALAFLQGEEKGNHFPQSVRFERHVHP